MSTEAENESLKQKYTDKYVETKGNVPELARFRGMVGRVVTVNHNDLALVDFSDGPWYDIKLEHLEIVPKPEKKAAPAHEKPAPKAAAAGAAEKKPAPAAGEKKVPVKKPVPKAKENAGAEG